MKTLAAADFALAAVQASVDTPEGDLAVAALFRELIPRWSRRFEAEPEVTAHPSSPQPRVLLRSATGMWRCEIAADRTDLYWIRPEPDAPAPSLADFGAIAAGLLGQYAEATGSRIGRMAALVSRVARHRAPALYLLGHLGHPQLTATAYDGIEAFDLSTRRRLALGGRFLVNASMWSRTTDEPGVGAAAVVLVDQDLNTLADRAAAERFTTADLCEFFAIAARDHDATLVACFPPPAS